MKVFDLKALAKAALLAAWLPGAGILADDTLPNNQSLLVGQSLTSANGSFQMILQPDGRIAVFRVEPAPASGQESKDPAAPVLKQHWVSENEGGLAGTGSLAMQPDNNLVIYDQVGTESPRAVWHSGTFGDGARGTGKLVMQDDGHLAIQCADATLWRSGLWEKDLRIGGRGTALHVVLPEGVVDEVRKAGDVLKVVGDKITDAVKKPDCILM